MNVLYFLELCSRVFEFVASHRHVYISTFYFPISGFSLNYNKKQTHTFFGVKKLYAHARVHFTARTRTRSFHRSCNKFKEVIDEFLLRLKLDYANTFDLYLI